MRRCFLPVLIPCVWLPLYAAGQTINWTGAVSTDWDNSTNWSPQQVPTAADHVVIAAGNVNFPADGVFGILDWTGGQLNGPVTVPANATLNWQAGTLWINSSLTVVSNGVLNLSGAADKYLYGPRTNAGTVTWGGTGNIQCGTSHNYNWYYAPIFNLPGALFDIQSDQTWLSWEMRKFKGQSLVGSRTRRLSRCP